MTRLTPTLLTFDAGGVLIELDLDFLSRRLRERGLAVPPERLAAALPSAWEHHDMLVEHGARHPWQALMATLLKDSGVVDPSPHVSWLWSEQAQANLWRKPIVPVVEIARELAAAGHRVAVLSNSEGRIAELLAEVGIADAFCTIVDSGRVGFAKPDLQIFEFARAQACPLGDEAGLPIHIGDSWAADVVGARNAGWRAVWYGAHARPVDDDAEIAPARDAAELRAVLARWLG